MKVFVVKERGISFSEFLEINSQEGLEFVPVGGRFSARDATSALGSGSDNQFCMMVSSLVVLPRHFGLQVANLITEIGENLGIAGETGRSIFPLGPEATSLVSYSRGVMSLPSSIGERLPALSLASICLLINRAVLAALSDSSDSELFLSGDFLVAESTKLGLKALIAPELSIFVRRREPLDYFSRDTDSRCNNGVDSAVCSQKKMSGPLSQRSLSIVTRTRFANLRLFARCIKSVNDLTAASSDVAIEHIVVSDAPWPVGPEIDGSYTRVICDEKVEDSRFKLIQAVLPSLKTDYVLFLDDDDWVRADFVREISWAISIYPKNSVFHLGATVFFERVAEKLELGGLELSHTVPADAARTAFRGLNQTPFSSVMFPLEVIQSIPEQAFESITILEDFYVLLSSWTSKNLPVFLPYDFAQISIREGGNSQNQKNRVEWIRAQANLASLLSISPNWQNNFSTISNSDSFEQQPGRLRQILVSLLDFKSVSYLLKLGLPRRLLTQEVSVRELSWKASLRSAFQKPEVPYTRSRQSVESPRGDKA